MKELPLSSPRSQYARRFIIASTLELRSWPMDKLLRSFVWTAALILIACQAVLAPVLAQDAKLKKEELDQLLAPIALYPDDLLSNVLMASTYPLDVVQAARWRMEPANAKLKGDALVNALEPKDWDPSIKALVQFPDVLETMSDKLDWTQRLGDAFLAQQDEVMDEIQFLRQKAEAAGNLKSNKQQTVSTEAGAAGQEVIVIEPASPEMVYVPVYEPTVVYGPWWYPDYPPYYFPPPPGFVYGAPFFPGFWWGPVIDIDFFAPFWGWGWCDWGHRSIHVDRGRYDRIPGSRPPLRGDIWQHDPYHRRGVAYRDPATAARFGRPVGSPQASRAYRGYQSAPQAAPRAQATVRPGAAATAPRAAVQRAPSAPQPAVQRPPSAPLPTVQRPPSAPLPTVQRGTTTQQPAAAAVQRPAAPAFGGYQRGADTRAESARGRASLQSIPAARSAAPAAGGARPSGGGSSGGGGGGARPSGGGS